MIIIFGAQLIDLVVLGLCTTRKKKHKYNYSLYTSNNKITTLYDLNAFGTSRKVIVFWQTICKNKNYFRVKLKNIIIHNIEYICDELQP